MEQYGSEVYRRNEELLFNIIGALCLRQKVQRHQKFYPTLSYFHSRRLGFEYPAFPSFLFNAKVHLMCFYVCRPRLLQRDATRLNKCVVIAMTECNVAPLLLFLHLHFTVIIPAAFLIFPFTASPFYAHIIIIYNVSDAACDAFSAK